MKQKYIIVGAGLFGSVIAERIANDLNENVLLIEKRDHIGGNCYSETDAETGIEYHKYGPHIFHTSSREVWQYISNFTEFNSYYHQVLTTHKDKVYQMPINLETINSFFNLNLKPFEVDDFLRIKIEQANIINPSNFEEKAISLIGIELYEAFIKGYTQKQWQKNPKDLPADIILRLPFRKNYNESYYNSFWQGIPLNGYTAIFEKMLNNRNIELLLNTDYFDVRNRFDGDAFVIYSGPIDRYFNYKYGKLEWRTLDFRKKVFYVEDYQGTTVMNYADTDIPYTRVHEPRHYHPERSYSDNKTLVIYEYSRFDDGTSPFYPINDRANSNLASKYTDEASTLKNVIINGRLGAYKYLDMDETIRIALGLYRMKIKNR